MVSRKFKGWGTQIFERKKFEEHLLSKRETPGDNFKTYLKYLGLVVLDLQVF